MNAASRRATGSVAACLVVVLALMLNAAGCKPRADAAAQPDVLIFARASDAQRLDPADVDDGESVNTLNQILEGLVRFHPGTLEIEPCLAAALPAISDDGLTYTFTLREGVRFHDGTPLTAEAAAWSFHRQMFKDHPGRPPGAVFEYWSSLYQDIADVRATDPHTLEVRLSRPNAALLSSLAIFPAHLISPNSPAGEAMQRRPIGTGPYRFVSWSPSQAIVLEANPDYWDTAHPPRFKRVVQKVVPENSVRLLELKAGNIHGLDGIQPAELKSLGGDARFTVYRDAGLNVGYLVFNLRHPRYQDPEVRLAFALALDRRQLVAVALDGAGVPADCPLPPGFLGYPKNPDPVPHDPEHARAILARHAADFAEPVRLHVMSTARPFLPDPTKASSLIRAQLEAVGLRVEIVSRDFKTHLDALRNFEYDCAIIGWIGDNGDPDNFLSTFFGSWATTRGSASNYADYRSAEMDRLLLAARRETDRVARAALYEQAIGLWRRDLPIVPLVHGETIAVWRREVTGFQIQKDGNLRLAGVGWAEADEAR
ncbi:MAG: ABC transporter substrate-binding protein [Opitutaceae bacterium]|nr:ABC transporter substrate-binding protein [Opitutaceae bacterium]